MAWPGIVACQIGTAFAAHTELASLPTSWPTVAPRSVQQAIRVGVRSIEHGQWRKRWVSPPPMPVLRPSGSRRSQKPEHVEVFGGLAA